MLVNLSEREQTAESAFADDPLNFTLAQRRLRIVTVADRSRDSARLWARDPRLQVPRATLRKASSPSPYRFGDGVLSRLFYEPPLPAKNRQIAKRSEKWEMVAGGWTRRMDKRGSRPRAELATRMSGRDSAALALFAIYALTVASWLVGGLAPVLSASFPTMLATFSEWAEGSGALASLSRRVVQDSTEAPTEQRF